MKTRVHRPLSRDGQSGRRPVPSPGRSRGAVALLCIGLALRGELPAFAHEGEQHGEPAPGAAVTSGPLHLSAQSKANLGLQTEEAQFRTIESVARCFAIVEGVPDRMHVVSIRTSGRATRVLVNEGDTVNDGQLLAEVEGRQIGNPPPILSVRSTLAGIVTRRDLLVGESIEPEKPLFQVADLSRVRVKCHVYEADVGKLRLGQRVRFAFEAYPDRTFEGTTGVVGGELENQTRTLPVWTELANADLALRPNMRGEGRLVVGVAADALAVPVDAVLGDAGNPFVYIEGGDVYERKVVVLGARDDRYVEIADGLVPGDRVVTQGNYQLQFAVSPQPVAAKPAAAAPANVAP